MKEGLYGLERHWGWATNDSFQQFDLKHGKNEITILLNDT